MSLTIDTLLRGAKADLKAGRPAAARVSLLQALERFPDNTRLLAQLAEVQAAATGLPARPFAAPQMAHFRQVRATAGLPAAIEDLLAQPDRVAALAAAGCAIERPPEMELCDRVATAIADGLVIGWFDGRMEWGPRALGHRSILGDPRRADMKDILNLKIKRRESFRPFAPSVLREAVPDWFERDGDVPFMMQVYPIRAEKRPLIPAVTHADGTGRLQTVTEAANGRYYHLIRAFQARTGVPMVLNTSFNENEPIVCTPEQALDCFLRTKMDLLVLGPVLIRRQG